MVFVVESRSSAGGALRLLLGPIVLPRPGLALVSNRPSENELETLPWSEIWDMSEYGRASEIVLKNPPWFTDCTTAERGTFDDGTPVCSTFNVLGVSKIVEVFGESKVGRFSRAACL